MLCVKPAARFPPPALEDIVRLPLMKEPMSSLKVRITFVPSVEVLGALGPVVTRVGRMPSTLCPDWASNPKTTIVVSTVVPVPRTVPPFSVNPLGLIPTPAGAVSSSTTS